jgi:hypothetical protein
MQLEVNFSSHWPIAFLDCITALISARGINNKKVRCEKCDVGLCPRKCSQDCHTKQLNRVRKAIINGVK